MNPTRNYSSRPNTFRNGPIRRGKPMANRGRTQNRGVRGERIDVSRFINKSVITEEVEHFVPEHKFADFIIDERLKANILLKGYKLPTPIQDRAIPHVLRGEDVVGIANTGTGKTAAFLIPLINKVLVAQTQGLGSKENILIMVPTRELAIQIDVELKGFLGSSQLFKIFSYFIGNIK